VQLADQTLADATRMLRRGEVSSRDLVDAALERAAETEACVAAYAYLDTDGARAIAYERDHDLARGVDRGPLHGVPVNVKDLLYTNDMPTRAGSNVLAGWEHRRDAVAVARLRDAGAVLLGKARTHEFAFGAGDPGTRNAWDHARKPGGSSAGSCVSVAAGSAYGSVGTDTVGSIRIPAAANGVVGLKPTYDVVSRAGVIPMSWTMDTVGPIARTAEDCAILLTALAEPSSLNAEHGRRRLPAETQKASLSGVRIGVDRAAFHGGLMREHAAVIDAALGALAGLGAEIVDVKAPCSQLAATISMTISTVDAAAWHDRFLRTRRERYAPGTLLEILGGGHISAVDYVQAQRARGELVRLTQQLYETHQLAALALPTLPDVGLARSGEASDAVDSDPLRFTRHVALANAVGLPALSLPCGFSGDELPVGLQLIGRPRRDFELLAIAHAYEQANGWYLRRPPRCTQQHATNGRETIQ
jgi:aspartyl-tRNA(Asn)/glutamyl-tRNA(Gln) amidotransferase subunit A